MEARPARPSGTQEARFLLDTNICIYIRRKKPEEVLRRFRTLKAGEAALSVITFGELMHGGKERAAGGDGKKQQFPHYVRDDIGGEGPVFFQGSLAARRAAGGGAGAVAGAGARASGDGIAGDGGRSLWNDSGGTGTQGADDREQRF